MWHRTPWGDFVALYHPPRLAIFLSWIAIGNLLAPAVDSTRLFLSLLAALFYMRAAYCIDELHGSRVATSYTDDSLKLQAIFGICAAWLIGFYLGLVYAKWLLTLALFGAILIVLYNFETLTVGRRLLFGVAWGFYPVVAHEVLQTLAFPSPAAFAWGLLAAAVACLHVTTYGLTGCRVHTCADLGRLKADCHGAPCAIRREIGATAALRPIHRLAKRLALLQTLIAALLVVAVAIGRGVS